MFKSEYAKFIVSKYSSYNAWERSFIESAQNNPEFTQSLEATLVQIENYLGYYGKPVEFENSMEGKLRLMFMTYKSQSGNWSNGYEASVERRRA